MADFDGVVAQRTLHLAAVGSKVGEAVAHKNDKSRKGGTRGNDPAEPRVPGVGSPPPGMTYPHSRVDQSCKSQAGTSPELAYTKDRASGLCPDPC